MGEEGSIGASEHRHAAGRAKKILTTATAYGMLLLASTPNIYMGFMTIPLIGYLILMIVNLPTEPTGPLFLLLGGSILDAVVLIVGLAFTLYSAVFLWRNRSTGLVTAGPYRLVRHPQYLGFILLTGALTSKSVWILEHTFGVSLLSVPETIAVWFVMVFVYVGLALFEERYLARAYQQSWTQYRGEVGFLLPHVVSLRKELEIVTAVILFGGLMLVLVLVGRIPFVL